MMGLHPCSVDAAFEAELQQVETWLQQEKYYAIGEIGLDFYHSNEWKTQQLEAFVFQIELAKKYNITTK